MIKRGGHNLLNLGYRCCGCGACSQVCPHGCISMGSDSEGFLYPQSSWDNCIDCKLCEKVCPILHPVETIDSLYAIGAKAKDEDLRLGSSSGGIFPILARKIIDEGGVVFGVKFNSKWQATFGYAEKYEDIVRMQGSKYVQASVGDAYVQVRNFLNAGRKVIFSGVECQIAGLKRFLCKDYENLITLSCACHGAPSPLVWEKTLLEFGDLQSIVFISFRGKKDGADGKNFILRRVNEEEIALSSEEMPFYRAFVESLIERPCCKHCMSENGSCADFLVADFWSANCYCKSIYDGKGVSFVSFNSSKALEYFPFDKVDYIPATIDNAREYNNGLSNIHKVHPRRKSFFRELNDINSQKPVSSLIEKKLEKTICDVIFETCKYYTTALKNVIAKKI